VRAGRMQCTGISCIPAAHTSPCRVSDPQRHIFKHASSSDAMAPVSGDGAWSR
jgi:hypothetical protein